MCKDSELRESRRHTVNLKISGVQDAHRCMVRGEIFEGGRGRAQKAYQPTWRVWTPS